MRISLDWVKELVNIENISLDEVVQKLTLGGFEVEEILDLIINNNQQTILEISATANRADSLSIKGISKEIGILLNRPSNISQYSTNSFELERVIHNSIVIKNNLEDCSTFIAISIENISNSNSPKWLQQKLLASELTPLNNLLDFQNYILLETGYPFEFYDLEKVQKKSNFESISLNLEFANSNVQLTTNNKSNHSLTDQILIVKNDKDILSIAGIIPNLEFSYDRNTTHLLIEGSIFNSKKIRQTARTLGLRTNRSSRYEKNLNKSFIVEALSRLILLLKIENPNIICKLNTITQKPDPSNFFINLKYETIKEILGPVVTKEITPQYILSTQVSEYLNRLNFEYNFNEQNLSWEIQIPESRFNDITREIDVIEEIGRLHGFNNFVTSLPQVKKIGREDNSYQIRKKITSCFLNQGLNELVNYSLVKKSNNNYIEIINPLLLDYSTLRISLLPNLLKNISENEKQGNLNIQGFEYGHVFSGNISNDYKEVEYIAGIFGSTSRKISWSGTLPILSWFEAKRRIEELFNKLNILVYWRHGLLEAYQNFFHPYKTSNLYLFNGNNIGIFGQIHPLVAKNLNISPKLYLFEFNFELLKNEIEKNQLPVYKNYSSYPKITKDLSFFIEKDILFSQIKSTILKNGTEFLIQVQLLDEYKGKSIPITSKSLCIQLVFQSDKKTLTNEKIESIIEIIKTKLTEKFNIVTRI